MVKSGTFVYGSGDTMDRGATKSLKKGEEANLVAKMHHSALARGRTVIEIQSTGPFEITYINAADDPRGAGAKNQVCGHTAPRDGAPDIDHCAKFGFVCCSESGVARGILLRGYIPQSRSP